MKIKLTPKQFFIAGLCLVAFVVIAANPSFTDFIASQFDTSGNVVKIKSGVVLTNVSEWGPMTVSDSITASNGFFSLGTAAGELVLGQGSGTGGIFDYSGATKSNEVVVVDAAGRFVSIPGTSFTNGSPQVWSNYQGMIFPSGTSVKGTAPISIATNGGIWIGPNAWQDLNIANPGGQAINQLWFSDSNEPPRMEIMFGVLDSENYTTFSTMQGTAYNDFSALGQSLVSWGLTAFGTNGDSAAVTIEADAKHNDNAIDVSTNNHGSILFSVSGNGLATANGFTDNSGTPGSLVAYQGGNRLGATNVAFVTVIDTTYITNQLAYITNLYATYITNNLAYITNLNVSYVTNNTAYITNLYTTYITNNLAYITNLYSTYITNNQLYSTNIYVTNLFASFLTNSYAYITNLFVNNLNVKNMYVTNNFWLTISAWPGATNNYDLANSRQQYTMTTACAVTNFLNVPGTGTELGSVLTLTNSTAGDLIVYFTPGGITTDDGARSYTVTNKTQRAFSIRVADTGTNVIARTFY